MDPMPPEALLAAYPPPMQAIAEKLRAIVRRAGPTRSSDSCYPLAT